jgi:hypothetical protein
MERYDRQGNPIADLLEWGRLHEDNAYKRVDATQIGKFWVSTVWLGLDHSFGGGPPLIFETMVFEDGGSDIYCDRYSTEQEAQEGHDEVVQRLIDGTFRNYLDEVVDSSFSITEEPTLI